MDPLILSALTSHAPALVVGAIFAIILMLGRLPAVDALIDRLPWWAKPLMLCLPSVEAVSQALLQGQSWLSALLVSALTPGVGTLSLLIAAYSAYVPHSGKVVVKPTITEPDTQPTATKG
jgi:hypothetical protein